MQDYNYLLSVEKAISRGPVLKTDEPQIVREGEENDCSDEGKNEGAAVLGAGQLEDADRQMLAKRIEETRGVVVKQAPKGMKRARENETAIVGYVLQVVCFLGFNYVLIHYRNKRSRKTVRWTVEWLVYGQGIDNSDVNLSNPIDEPKRMLSSRVQENRPLADAFVAQLHHSATSTISTATPSSSSLPLSSTSKCQKPTQPSSTKATRRAFASSCQFYLKSANVPANEPTLIELAPETSLSASLRGQAVFEFPTILVVAKEAGGVLAGWKIIERPKDQKGSVEDGKKDRVAEGEGGVGAGAGAEEEEDGGNIEEEKESNYKANIELQKEELQDFSAIEPSTSKGLIGEISANMTITPNNPHEPHLISPTNAEPLDKILTSEEEFRLSIPS